MELSSTVLSILFNLAAVLLAAPLLEGMVRRVTARVQSRQGPPLLQPYFDILKLLGKEDLESGEARVMQRLAAYGSLATALTLACLVPLGFRAPLAGAGDIILLIYMLTLSSMCTLLAGLAAGSTYSLVGISREMMAMLTLEPLFAVAVIAGAVHTGSLRLDAVLNGSVFAVSGFPFSGLLLLLVMILSFQAFVQRLPFDMSEAETEIMEGPLVEYSGPKLALFKAAKMVKLVVYSALFISIFIPWGGGSSPAVSWLVFWLKVFVVVLLVTLTAAVHARYRIDQAVRFFCGMLALSFCALILAGHGY